MNAAPLLTVDRIAADAYAAMCAPPDFVQLAAQLTRAESRTARAALIDAADATAREAALRYLAEPDATRERDRRLVWLRADPRRFAALKHHYAAHVADFISEWGVTVDPRRIARGKHALVPFTLWPKQRELVDWLLARWTRSEPGVVVKSRDVGASWVGMAVLATLSIYTRNFAAGIASATEAKLDRSGDPDTLFYKLREFLKHLPPEFRAGYDESRHSAYLRVNFPDPGSSITGEAGDQAGRGARKSLYIVDESAHFERPALIDAALAATTDCRIDMSSVNGIGNSFYDRAHNAAVPRFDITWRDDPRKDDAWYAAKRATLDPVIVAQEIDCSFTASVEGVVIPAAHVQAAIGLAERLGITPAGARYGALDVADRGQDKNAFAIRHGVVLEHVESWSGATSDIFGTTSKTFRICDEHRVAEFLYDADGLGAGVRGDARVLNDARPDARIKVCEYRGSAAPLFPNRLVPRTDRKWQDYAANRKAQAWLHVRMMFAESFKASRGEPYDVDAVVSINPKIPELSRLTAELSQATMSQNAAGKLLVDKVGDGERSPNLADALVIAFAPRQMPLKIHPEAAAILARPVARRPIALR
jgi:hypothetical protein